MADTALLCRIKNRAPENENLAIAHVHMYTHTHSHTEKNELRSTVLQKVN